jgi:hypothetical protein
MTVFSGFFNSNNTHDRMYNAEHFSRFFDGLICDGVYISYPYEEEDKTKKAFYVKPAVSGLAVTVATGRAWFDGIWLWNDSTLSVSLDPTSNELMQRIDAIVLDIDKTDAGRQGQILVVKGTEDTKEHTVYRPTLIDQPTHKQYPIAFVNVLGGATSISAANITYTVGTNDEDAIPIVRALLELADDEIQAINARFDADENPSYTEAATLAEPLSGEPVTTLYGKIKKLFTTLFAGRSSTTPKFLRHDLTYATPPVADVTQPGYCPQRPVPAEQMEDDKYKYLRADGSWAVPPGGGEGGGDTVIQRSAANANNNFKVLLSATDQAVNDTDITKWDADFRYNPSTDNLTVGSVNEVKLAKSGNKYGYMDGSTFKSFRQPTGDAVASNVLSGKTFSNANSDSLTGTMVNRGPIDTTLYGPDEYYYYPNGYYSGLSFRVRNYHDENTYEYPTGSTGTPIVDLGTYHNIRYINAAKVYTSGRNQGHADIQLQTLKVAVEQYNGIVTAIRLYVTSDGTNFTELPNYYFDHVSAWFNVKVNYNSGIVAR